MAWALSDPRDAAALAAPTSRRPSLWQRLLRTLADPYRPERHYMRGPGPKWHAKHGRDRPGAEQTARKAAAGSRSLWTHII
jgi:hypothetical protein